MPQARTRLESVSLKRFPEKDELMLNVGDKAPNFSLLSDSGSKLGLKDFSGGILVLYFFPKADTPG
jgi:peroxiredoxin